MYVAVIKAGHARHTPPRMPINSLALWQNLAPYAKFFNRDMAPYAEEKFCHWDMVFLSMRAQCAYADNFRPIV